MSRKKLVLTATILALILVIGGILAYFTDSDTKVNQFKMSSVQILVEEPSWPNKDTDGSLKPIENVVPNQEINKDPQVTNKGSSNIYAFVEVTVPHATVTIEGATTPADTQLFSYTVNDGWVQVGTRESVEKTDENDLDKYVYVYGYVGDNTNGKLKALAKNASTNAVFDKVKFADLHEESYADTVVQGKTLDVVVTGYGIQTSDVDDTKTLAQIFQMIKSE